MDLMRTDGLKEQFEERRAEIERAARVECERQTEFALQDLRAADAVPRTDYNAARVARVVSSFRMGVDPGVNLREIYAHITTNGGGPGLVPMHDFRDANGAGTGPPLEAGVYAVVVEVYRVDVARKARIDVSGEHPSHVIANHIVAQLEPLDWEQQLNVAAYVTASVTREHGVSMEQFGKVVGLYHRAAELAGAEDPASMAAAAHVAGREAGIPVTDDPARPPIAAPAAPSTSEQIEGAAAALGATIAEGLSPDVGFVLMLFGFNSSFTSYFSNAQRPDAVRALRELADRLEGD